MWLVHATYLASPFKRLGNDGCITLPAQRGKFSHSAADKVPAPLAPRPGAVEVIEKDAHNYRVRGQRGGKIAEVPGVQQPHCAALHGGRLWPCPAELGRRLSKQWRLDPRGFGGGRVLLGTGAVYWFSRKAVQSGIGLIDYAARTVPGGRSVAGDVVCIEKIRLAAGAAGYPLPTEVVAREVAIEQVAVEPVRCDPPMDLAHVHDIAGEDRKSTRLNSSH